MPASAGSPGRADLAVGRLTIAGALVGAVAVVWFGALMWWAREDAGAVGVFAVSAAQGLPMCAAPFAGRVVRRRGARRVLRTVLLIDAVALSCFAAAMAISARPLTLTWIVAAVLATRAGGVFAPATLSQLLLERSDGDTAALSRRQAASGAAKLAAAPLIPVAILAGPAWVTAAAAAALVPLLVMLAPRQGCVEHPAQAAVPAVSRWWGGTVATPLLTFAWLSLFSMNIQPLIATVARSVGELGWFSAAVAAGSAAAGLAWPRLGSTPHRWVTLWAPLVVAAGAAGMVAPQLASRTAATFVLAAGLGALSAAMSAVVADGTEDHQRASGFGAMSAVAAGTNPPGAAMIAGAVSAAGPAGALLLTGAGALAAPLVASMATAARSD